MRFGIAVLFVGLVAGCVYGPKAERKTPLNYLNGEHYQTAPDPEVGERMLVPFAERKDKRTHVRGRVVRKENIVEIPIRHVPVAFVNDKGARVIEGRTDTNGEFALSGIVPNGAYVLEVQAGVATTRHSVEVNSYEIGPLVIEVGAQP